VQADQLALDLPHRTALGAEDFLVSSCNLAAVELIDAWPHWDGPVQMLIGPAGCGKTHLARVWQSFSGARRLSPDNLHAGGLDVCSQGSALIVEDIDSGAYDEKGLFHLLNMAQEQGLFVLLSARTPPAGWAYELPDLVSRLRTLPRVGIGTADDALLKAVILKQFTDRQLDVEPKVIDFLAHRIERSLETAGRVVEAVDRQALAENRKITRQLVANVLKSATFGG
jgi:chromosomal replication initiation ATPase DnaA